MRPVEGREAWDALLLELPEAGPGPDGGRLVPHLLQCWDWGALKARLQRVEVPHRCAAPLGHEPSH